MRNRFARFVAASVAVTGTLSVSAALVAGQGAQTKAPAPAPAPAPAGRGQTPAAPAAPARGTATAPAGNRATAAPARVQRIDGKPNFNGLWQAMNTGELGYSGSFHAEPGPYYQLGAAFAVPPGQGIVEGNEIPYRPEALEQKKKNCLNRWTADPEIKCFMPGIPRATTCRIPSQIVQGTSTIAFAYEFATANRVVKMTQSPEGTGSFLDGLVEWPLGGRYAGYRSHRKQ